METANCVSGITGILVGTGTTVKKNNKKKKNKNKKNRISYRRLRSVAY